MSKILFISNIAKRVGSFSVASIEAAHTLNMDYHMAAKWNATSEQIAEDENTFNVKIHNVDLDRSPYSIRNIKAYKQIVKIIRDEKIDYIHCNTPVGGILGRLAGKKCMVKKVIYQVHGFHFYKGAPKKNWILYYTVEKWLAHYTDILLTINREDYELADSKMKLRDGGKVYYVPGVGIDMSRYDMGDFSREQKRSELGLNSEDVALISMGDLIKRKNYDVSIRAVAEAKNDKIHYFICGKGPEEEALKKLASELGVSEQIHFLGFRSDIKELLAASDIFLFTTKQEGLPRSMMEAMASGLPCIASRIRGNTDLLENTDGGYLCDTDDVSAYAEKLNLLASDEGARKLMGKNNLVTIQKFSTDTVVGVLRRIYSAELE